MRQRTSITGCVRWSVGPSVGRLVCNAFARRSTRRTLLAYLALFHYTFQAVHSNNPTVIPHGLIRIIRCPFFLFYFKFRFQIHAYSMGMKFVVLPLPIPFCLSFPILLQCLSCGLFVLRAVCLVCLCICLYLFSILTLSFILSNQSPICSFISSLIKLFVRQIS